MKVIPRTITDNPLQINFQITLFKVKLQMPPVTDILLQNGTIICFITKKKIYIYIYIIYILPLYTIHHVTLYTLNFSNACFAP